mmetsp:Transcript_1582/g.4067  ORF Transcript_1582/g.4067 Transcript_1582/m.4067 type:complete len:190 (-) Transcript_1582:160-729(-)
MLCHAGPQLLQQRARPASRVFLWACLLLASWVAQPCLSFVSLRLVVASRSFDHRGDVHSSTSRCAAGRDVESYVEKCKGLDFVDNALSASKADGPPVVVLSFSTTWCGPCKLMDPHVNEFSRMFKTSVRFIKVTGDQDPDGMAIMKKEGVRSVPQYHIYKEGEKVDTVMGAKKEILLETLMKHAAVDET